MDTDKKQAAFVLRIAPSGIDKVPEALHENEIIIGWAYADGLLNSKLDWEQFREILNKAYYSKEPTLRKGRCCGWQYVAFYKGNEI